MDADIKSLSNSSQQRFTEPYVQRWHIIVQRFALCLAIATLGLMALGSATRVMNAGLACPDWPLCYGEFMPRHQMNLQVFLEWFHRLVASTIGLLTIILTGISWWQRSQLPPWTPWSASLALVLVVFQGILGGLTVTELLRFDIVTAHLGTGLLFFSTLLAISMALMPYQPIGTAGKLLWFGLAAVILVYLQSVLGALVSSRWALHQCFGASQLCRVMNSHILGVIPATVATLTLVWLTRRSSTLHGYLRNLSRVAGALLVLQITLGVATFRLHLQVEPLTVAHQAIGASLLGALVAFTVIAVRDVNVDITSVDSAEGSTSSQLTVS